METLYEIPGYEGNYSITKSGRVWSHPKGHHDGIWLKEQLHSGYAKVVLGRKKTKIDT